MITLARDLGHTVVEEPISRDQLYIADEVFVCGTAAEVVGLREIDFRTIGSGKTGPVTRALQAEFDKLTSGRHARSAAWFSPVPAFDAGVGRREARKGEEGAMKKHKHHPETEAVRGGTDLEKKNGPVTTPIYQTATFEVTDSEQQVRATSTDMFYTRYGNPTHTVAEKAIAELEGADAALLFASGMERHHYLDALPAEERRPRRRPARHLRRRYEVLQPVAAQVRHRNHFRGHRSSTISTRAPSGPTRSCFTWNRRPIRTLRVVDLNKVVALARQHNLITFIDSTFATPINQRPADFGIDLIMHSGTKYFAGHSDLICGIVAGRQDLIETIHATRTTLGGTMDPHAAWLLLRGIKTLAVRVQRQNDNALRVAQFLAHHAKVTTRALSVSRRPSAARSGDGADARRRRCSELRSGWHRRRRQALSEALHLFTLAPSLGGVDSLVTIPVLTSHGMISAEHRQKMGVTDQLIRLSVGIENADDLIADLEQALTVVSNTRQHAEVG